MFNEQTILNQTQLLHQLSELCLQQKTGTLFMIIQNDHAAGFVIKQGEITYCFFDHLQGVEALEQIKNITLAKCSFSEKILFSFIDHLNQLSTVDIFTILGYHYEPPLDNQSTEKSVKIYRGNIVQDEVVIAEETNPTQTIEQGGDETKKNKRVYRGQTF